jgi:acyl carrier protein
VVDVDGLAARIREFLRGELGVEQQVDADTPLMSSGLVDSAGVVRLAALLETATGLVIPDRDVTPANFDSLARITSYLQRRTAR